MIIAGMILITLLLLLLLVRGRGRKPAKNREWELQEATWGIQARDGWDDIGSFGGQVALLWRHLQPYNLNNKTISILHQKGYNSPKKHSPRDGLSQVSNLSPE